MNTIYHFLLPYSELLLFIANLHTLADLLLASVQDVAKKCKTSPIEVKQLFDKVLNSVPLLKFNALDTLPEDEIFTTGDATLDSVLGGGIRTCMVWEVAGERYHSIWLIPLFIF